MFPVNLQPDSSAFYDAMSENYIDVFLDKKKYHDAVDNLVRSNEDYSLWLNVLDVGSGDGRRIISLFPNQKCKLHSVENSGAMAALLRKSSRITKVIHHDFCSLDSRDFGIRYDVILMQWNVLGHLANISKAFKLASQTVKVGGHFIFDCNNPLNYKHYGIFNMARNLLKLNLPLSKGSLKFKIAHGNSITETRFYSVGHISKLLEFNGFKVNKIVYLDYITGTVESRYRGQAFIDAVKL